MLEPVSRRRSAQRGFSLIEVLVTVVLLSIGFLTTAKMQVSALRSNQSSLLNSKAVLLSAEIMEKMRNNPVGVENGNYSNKTTSGANAAPCGAAGCSPAQLAARDLFEWSAHFMDVRGVGNGYLPTLPGVSATQPATGSISNPIDGVYTISISWQGLIDGEPVPESFSAKFIP